MIPSTQIAIALTTFYKEPDGKDRVRFLCALRQVMAAVSAGHLVIIVDDSPNNAVENTLSTAGALVFRQQRKGMGSSKREAALHAMALGARTVIMNEAEKYDIVRHIDNFVRPLNGQANIVVAKRTSLSDNSYPSFQIKTEKEADDAFEKITGLVGIRPMFGPVAFDAHRAGIYFTGFHPAEVPRLPDTYVQHFAPVVAVYENKGQVRVSSVALDFEYPPDQKAEEEAADNDAIRAKRIQQRDSLIEAYRLLVDHLKKK